jgi:hypothetical protein
MLFSRRYFSHVRERLMGNTTTSGEEYQDESGIEITPLHQTDKNIGNSAKKAASLPSSSHQHRISPGKRRTFLQFAIVCCATIFVVIVLLGSFPNLLNFPNSVLQALTQPAPTQLTTLTPLPNINHFYVQAAFPGTTILLDGHPFHASRLGTDAPLKLANGIHHIIWSAVPFRSQSCQFPVPFIQYIGNNTCYVAPIENENQAISPQVSLIVLGESLATLPTQARTMLKSSIQNTFAAHSSSAMIMPGELYAAQYGTSFLKATQPIVATQQFQPLFGLPLPVCSIAGISSIDCSLAGQNCLQLCPVPWQPHLAQTTRLFSQRWLVLTFVRTLWNYTTLNGHIIFQDQELDGLAHLALLSITWNGSWHVKALMGAALGQPLIIDGIQILDNPACSSAEDIVGGQIAAKASQEGFISGPNPADGCLVETILRKTAGMPSSPSPPMAYFLERFGILLAVNDVAQQSQPDLPLADAHEKNIASQLIQLPGQYISSP